MITLNQIEQSDCFNEQNLDLLNNLKSVLENINCKKTIQTKLDGYFV